MSAPTLEEIQARLGELAETQHAENTVGTYANGWKQFTAWAAQHHLVARPATGQTVALWATSMTFPRVDDEGQETWLSPNTLSTYLAAIPWAHVDLGLPVPDMTVADQVAANYHRARSDAGWKPRQVDPLELADLRKIRDSIDFSRPIGVRDWAIVMLTVALMGRRSEVACLDISDVALEDDDDGQQWLMIRICSSKTDQAGNQTIVQIPRGRDHTLCPVTALLNWMTWLAMRNIKSGPLFRSLQGAGTKLTVHGEAKSPEALSGRLTGHAIGRVFKRLSKRAGLSATLDIAGHSGRTTGVTLSYSAGARLTEIADQGRWKRGSTALQRYIRRIDMRRSNPIKLVF